MPFPRQSAFQQVTTFLGPKEDERQGLFKSSTVLLSARDSGVRGSGILFNPLQHWGGVGTGTALIRVGIVTLRKLAQLSMPPEVMDSVNRI